MLLLLSMNLVMLLASNIVHITLLYLISPALITSIVLAVPFPFYLLQFLIPVSSGNHGQMKSTWSLL